MTLIEIETSFGIVAAAEQALVDVILEMLVVEAGHRATPADLVEALRW